MVPFFLSLASFLLVARSVHAGMLDFSVDTAHWPAAALQQRVVITTGSYDHAVDGVALTLNRLAAHLLRQGHEVLVLSPGRGSWLREHRPVLRHAGTLVRIPSVPLPIWSEYRLTFGLGRRARAALADFGPTVLHVAVQDALGHAAVRWAEGNGVPVLCSHHTRWNAYLSYYALARGMRAPLESFMCRSLSNRVAARDTYGCSLCVPLASHRSYGAVRSTCQGLHSAKAFSPAKAEALVGQATGLRATTASGARATRL